MFLAELMHTSKRRHPAEKSVYLLRWPRVLYITPLTAVPSSPEASFLEDAFWNFYFFLPQSYCSEEPDRDLEALFNDYQTITLPGGHTITAVTATFDEHV